MNNLFDFSKYLNDLNKHGKYENILISFNDNAHNFSQDEISNNAYLIYNLLNSFRKTHRIDEGIEFLEKYNIIPSRDQKLILNTYGWLIYDKLKMDAENKSDNYSNEKTESTLIKAKTLLPTLDIMDDHEVTLLKLLISAILRIEKRKDVPDHNVVFDLFKSIGLKNNPEMKKIIASEEYILVFALDILKKTQQFRYADPLLRSLEINLQAANSKILNSYGWLIFSKLKTEFTEKNIPEGEAREDMNSYLLGIEEEINATETNQTNDTIQKTIKIISLFDFNSKYSPFSKLFQLVIKFEKSKPNPNWKFLLEFIELFDISKLSTECEQFTFEKNGKPKTIELASDQEIWYSTKITSLFKLNEYQQCLTAIEEAKLNITKLHYRNDPWFLWKVGLCKRHLGKVEEATADIEKVLNKKQEWFVQKELAELYLQSGKTNEALKLGINAALNFGDKEKKDSLYFVLGEIHQKIGDNEKAYQHYTLAKLIRESQEWKIPQKYLNISVDPLFASFVPSLKLNDLYKLLLNYWKNLKLSDPQKDTPNAGRFNSNGSKLLGKIKMINYEKGFGFITDESGKEHYFKTRSIHKTSGTTLAINNRVSFEYLPAKGDKKGEAINVKIALN
jgi:cold shock CspA family protein/DNA-binding XRE family transcriptional regulator